MPIISITKFLSIQSMKILLISRTTVYCKKNWKFHSVQLCFYVNFPLRRNVSIKKNYFATFNENCVTVQIFDCKMKYLEKFI